MPTNTIIINNQRYEIEGSNIKVITDGDLHSISVSGNKITQVTGAVKIQFEGDLATLNCAAAEVSGSVHGDVKCSSLTSQGDINGNVSASNIKCNNIKGNVTAANVKCNNISM
jgi:cytoskeletal protein CcmA (bactofilin family)